MFNLDIQNENLNANYITAEQTKPSFISISSWARTITATYLIDGLAHLSLCRLFVFLSSPPYISVSSLPHLLASLALTLSVFSHLLILLLCQLFSFLSRQLSASTSLACLLLPTPVTLEGFNHQLIVTPYIGI